jgi:hypothetical protein
MRRRKMKMNRSMLFLILGLFVVAGQSASANTKLGDVMGNIADQVTELNTFSKLVAKDVNARTFAKAQSRSRLVQILFTLADDKKGTLDAAGALLAADMTPDKFTTLTGKDLEDFVKEYSSTLKDVSAIFAKIETELAAQVALADATTRDFTQLKALLGDVSTAMRAAHKVFR